MAERKYSKPVRRAR